MTGSPITRNTDLQKLKSFGEEAWDMFWDKTFNLSFLVLVFLKMSLSLGKICRDRLAVSSNPGD